MRIAISGKSGCGNTTATNNVGKALGLKIVNYTFRDLARDIKMSFNELHNQALKNPIFDFLTDLTLIRQAILNENIVVGTRLASWMMDADLRIWLHAPLETRAGRITKRKSEENYSYEETLYKTLKRDKQNYLRYIRLYGIDIEDHSDFDITINTEKLTAEQVSSLIVEAAKWAKNNMLDRKNIHLSRVVKIIAENIDVDEKKLWDPRWELNIKEIFERSVSKNSF